MARKQSLHLSATYTGPQGPQGPTGAGADAKAYVATLP